MKWKNGQYGSIYLMFGKLAIGSVAWGVLAGQEYVARIHMPIGRVKSGFKTGVEAKLWIEDQAYRDASDIQRSLGEVVSSRGVQAS